MGAPMTPARLGFFRAAAAVPRVKVADCRANARRIVALAEEARRRGAALAVFPELSVTGYTCGDLFGQPLLLQQAEEALAEILRRTAGLDLILVAGVPVPVETRLYNCAAVMHRGTLLGLVPKSYLPNYGEFYEARWFCSGAREAVREVEFCGRSVRFGRGLLFEAGGIRIGVELCEDLWVPVPPSSLLATAGAELIVNLSASDEMAGKHAYLRSLIAQQSARTLSAYLYCSAGFGESSTDLVFAGNGIAAENGTILRQTERFSLEEQLLTVDFDIDRLRTLRRRSNTFAPAEPQAQTQTVRDPHPLPETAAGDGYVLERPIDPHPFVPSDRATMDERCNEIFDIQIGGLAQRLVHTAARTAVIGISGGLDSTLALLVTVKTFDKLGRDRRDIVGVTMPGFGTTDRTYTNAVTLIRELGITLREISIRKACLQHFEDIGLDPSDRSAAYENGQARERTQILMDIANQTGGLVVGTGDLSELALGWATYNGDHMSMYGVNGGVPKTLVKHLVRWTADNRFAAEPVIRATLCDIIDTPISPELLPADEKGDIAQKTEDLVGPYELHDFYLYNFVRQGFAPEKIYFLAKAAFAGKYDAATLLKWLKTFFRRFFSQQFKRSALPDGPKVGSVSLSPRGDWRMPSDACAAGWLRQLDALEPPQAQPAGDSPQAPKQ